MIGRFFVWFSRLGHCKGFGIQSPWAYGFVCDVVNERHPYYAYDELDMKYHHRGFEERKLGRLYMRIANFLQPVIAVDLGTMPKYSEYIKAGCAKSIVTNIGEIYDMGIDNQIGRSLLYASQGAKTIDILRAADMMLQDGCMMVLESIYKDKEMKMVWNDLKKRDHIISFDLYYCGIIYRDDKRYREAYMVNF